MTQIAFLLYPDVTALDAVGPHEVLARLPGAEVRFVATTPGPIRTDVGMVMTADSGPDDVPAPDIIVVPGGPGTLPALEDTAAVEWLRQAHERSRWTTLVCTGTAAGVSAGIDMALRLKDETRRRATALMVPNGAEAQATA